VLTGGRRRRAHTTASVAEARARFGLPLDQPVGLFLGNREPYRGLDALLGGIAALEEPRILPGVIAVAGPERDSVPRSDRVRPLGRVEDVATLLTAVDFVINVNRFSLFDLSLVEALEAGVPLLLHDTGGNRAFARLGAGCVGIRDLSPATVADGLERMFASRPSDLALLADRSRACYAQHLTIEAFRHGHRALYASAARTACA
jgi:glycosyltransferase involved in cell wall biosynthesis